MKLPTLLLVLVLPIEVECLFFCFWIRCWPETEPDPTPSPTPCNSNPTISSNSQFEFTFQFDSSVPTADQSLFTAAQSRWREVVIGGLEDTTVSSISTDCGTISGTVDDIAVCVKYESLDGAGNVLAEATILDKRTSGADAPLATVGQVVFDSDDGTPTASIIQHELGHILGIGSLWGDKGIAGTTGACTYKEDSRATQEWRCLTGCTSTVPIQSNVCGHWDENCLQEELMTPNLDGDSLPISKITAAALEDLGYLVNYNGADMDYTTSSISSSCRCNNRRLGELGSTFSSVRRRKLTVSQAQTDSLAYAIQYGKEKLRARQKTTEGMRIDESASFVGGRAILIVYVESETGRARSVVVTDAEL